MEREAAELRDGLPDADAQLVSEGGSVGDEVAGVDAVGDGESLQQRVVDAAGVDVDESESLAVMLALAETELLVDIVGDAEREREPVTLPRA